MKPLPSIAAGESANTVVMLSAEPGSLSPEAWQELTTKIFRGFAKRVYGLPLIPGVD